MKGSVYLYFGDRLLTNGSFEDMRKLGIMPVEGLPLNFYEIDADDQDRPTYLCAKGTLYLDHGAWYAEIDTNSFYSVLRSEVD
jgi:hypothetical protein